MRIQHNIAAMNSYRNYVGNSNSLAKNLEKLSSGYRINRAGDDAAGLAISEKMRAQIAGLDQAQSNVKDGISLVKTAEGALQEVQNMMNRMVSLATQSANGTYQNEVDRENLQAEVEALKSEINRIADSSNFNGQKLLDGSLEAGQLSELPVEFNTTSATAGLTINEATAGGGTKGQFVIDISKAFSQGDSITIGGTKSDGTAMAGGKTFTFSNLDNATPATSFKGDTAEAQAKDLASKLGIDSEIGTNFDITVDGTKITLTAKEEGTDTPPTITSVTLGADSDVTATVTNNAGVAANGTAGTASKYAIELIGGSNAAAAALQAGDVLTFQFKDDNGNLLEAEVKVTDAMISADAKTSTEAVVDALKTAKFKDLANTTGVDESQMTVDDLFDLTANTAKDGTAAAYGSIYVKGSTFATAAGNSAAVGVTLNRGGNKTTVGAVQGTNSSAVTDGVKDKITIADPTVNFSAGDKVTFEGALRDGSTFKVELVAGKDFKIDTDSTDSATNTMTNLTAALQSKDLNVTVTGKDGTEKTVTGEDLFGTNGEFAVNYATNTLTIESKYAGTAASFKGNEISATITALDDAKVEMSKTLATPQTAAQSSFTVGEGLEYGAAVKVGDVTYEIVADARDTTNRSNTAIVVDDLTDTAGIAAKLAEAIGKDQTEYAVSASGDTVSISSNKIGSDQVALDITAPYGDEITTASFKFDPKAIEEGSVLEFNGNTYEFVKTGEKAATSGAIAIEVADFEAATAKSLGDAFANVAKNGIVSVADDGTVTLKSLEAKDGTISKPTISFGNTLTLQIGDTAESYNQLEVSIGDMHTKALGIADIDIGNIKGAQAAIETIKTAINTVSSTRGNLGAIQNRLEHTSNNLSVMTENIQDAEATIRDTDIADEMTAYTKNNILLQSAQAMLAQANQMPQGVLQLLQ